MTLSARLKAWVKPLVVPVWNAAHCLGWLIRDYLGAITSGRFGRCIVCGRSALFIYRRRVVTPRLQELWGLSPALANALATQGVLRLLALRRQAAGPQARAGLAHPLFGQRDTFPLSRTLGRIARDPQASRG